MNPFKLFAEETSSVIASTAQSAAESATATSTAVSNSTSILTENGINWYRVGDIILEWCTTTGIKLIISIIFLIISFKIVNFISKRIIRHLEKRKADVTLSRVLNNTLRIAIKILLVITVVAYLGVETSSFAAVISSIGIGISLAVQGSLSNFVGGVIIVIMRPFKIGDFITSNNESGTVEDIKLFYTQIVTPDNKVIYIPNGNLANNVIVNASVKNDRRVDIVMTVSYDTNLDLAKNVLRKVCNDCNKVYNTPKPFVEITNFLDSSIEITVKAWCLRADYWDVKFYLLSEFKNALDENHIEIPFNQLDVTIKNQD